MEPSLLNFLELCAALALLVPLFSVFALICLNLVQVLLENLRSDSLVSEPEPEPIAGGYVYQPEIMIGEDGSVEISGQLLPGITVHLLEPSMETDFEQVYNVVLDNKYGLLVDSDQLAILMGFIYKIYGRKA